MTRGLGQLANTVKSYGGELDDESLGTGRLPMVLVTFGGARIEPMGVRGTAFRTSAKFVVIVAVRSLRSNQAARQGGWINAGRCESVDLCGTPLTGRATAGRIS